MPESLAEYSAEFSRLCRELEVALEMLDEQSRKWAREEVTYRKAHAEAILRAEGKVAEQEAQADIATARERYNYLIAERLARVAREKVESVRTQISALQSLLNLEKQERAFAQTGPEGGY